jgi:hypothetical protein
MLNRDIISKFHVDDAEYNYKITIKVEGPEEMRRSLIENISFDIAGQSFWGLPIVDGFSHTSRVVFVSPSPLQETLVRFPS